MIPFLFLKKSLPTFFLAAKKHPFLFSGFMLMGIFKHGFFLGMWHFFCNEYLPFTEREIAHLYCLYGSLCIGMGTVHSFCHGLEKLPHMLKTGSLDFFLVRPSHPLWIIAFSHRNPAALGDIVAGVLCLAFSGILFSKHVLAVFCAILVTTLFCFALQVFLASTTFLSKYASFYVQHLKILRSLTISTPHATYSGPIRLLTYAALFFIALQFFTLETLQIKPWPLLLYTFLGTLCFFALACFSFHKGLQYYAAH